MESIIALSEVHDGEILFADVSTAVLLISDYGRMGRPDYSGIQATEGKIRGIGNKNRYLMLK